MKKMLTRINETLHHYEKCKKVSGKNDRMSGDCSGLRGNCTGLSGNCTGLRGDCSGLQGNLDECELDRTKRTDIAELIKEDTK